MRVTDDVRRCVVFIGFNSSEGKFEPAGTGFFVVHKGHRYLLTAQHIAVAVADAPFAIRLIDPAWMILN